MEERTRPLELPDRLPRTVCYSTGVAVRVFSYVSGTSGDSNVVPQSATKLCVLLALFVTLSGCVLTSMSGKKVVREEMSVRCCISQLETF
jgi:hypothetical protein